LYTFGSRTGILHSFSRAFVGSRSEPYRGGDIKFSGETVGMRGTPDGEKNAVKMHKTGLALWFHLCYNIMVNHSPRLDKEFQMMKNVWKRTLLLIAAAAMLIALVSCVGSGKSGST